MKKLVLAGVVSLLVTVGAQAQTIGITMARFDSTFLTLLLNGMRNHAKTLPGITLQAEDGQNDTARQLNQVQNFIASRVDAIIVAAVDGETTPAMTKLATEAGIPIIYVNHPPADLDTLPKGAAFVGSNEVDSGTLQATEVCRLLGGKGRLFVLMGPLDNFSALQRTKDIEDVIATSACRGMSIIDKQTANWDRSEALNLMSNWLSAGTPFDAVVANNDEMAIGAIAAMKGSGVDLKKIVVAGVDATPDGLAAMKAGELRATVFQNAAAQGTAAVDAAIKLARKQPVDQKIWVPFELVTPDNMAAYLGKN